MSSDSSDSDDEHQLLMIQCIAFAAGTAAPIYGLPLYDKTPYHTSALTGADWVRELLNGHPGHIHNELGIHKHVFYHLITALEQAGVHSSKHVFLKEQLAMFLYTCVTGLSLRHVSEQFQRANETTSWYVSYFIQDGLR
jgi:hypothetical protein